MFWAYENSDYTSPNRDKLRRRLDEHYYYEINTSSRA